MNQKKIGILLSYSNLIVGMVLNIFLTPLMISSFGDVDYSIFKVMQSFAGPLSMFHLGISTIVTRCIVKYKTIPEFTEKEKKNTIALSLLASAVMSLFVIIAGVIMYMMIPKMYGANYSADTLLLGRKIFVLFVGSAVFHMLTDAFSGCIIGNEKFTVSSAIPLCRSVIKVGMIFVLLKIGFGALSVVMIECVLSLAVLVFTALYAMGYLKEIPKLSSFDKKQITEIVLFGSAILLQAVVNQVNNNVDTMILGVYISEKAIITMYSSALAVYGVYNSLISVVPTFFLPKATKLVSKNASGKELTDFVILPGRFQAIIAVACIFGFALFGRNFISIWIGEKYMDAYWVILMLMIPVTIPLVENTAISILDATLKRIYRSTVLVIMAVLNVIISVILVSFIGFWGAATGTIISLIVGHGFMMNIYYAKTFKMEIGRMFRSIFKGILPAGILASLPCIPLAVFLKDTLLFFVLKCIIFIIIYFAFLFWFGIDENEKKIIFGSLNKGRKLLDKFHKVKSAT